MHTVDRLATANAPITHLRKASLHSDEADCTVPILESYFGLRKTSKTIMIMRNARCMTPIGRRN